MNLDFISIADAARYIKARELSPVELVDHLLKRIERLDPQIHSFITVLAEDAHRAAKISEQEIMKGQYRGSLHGIPIGLKDNIDTAGARTTYCSRLFENNIPSHDAAVVRHLVSSGAIILGKLALHEFSFGGPSFDLPWPPARNPWDLSRFSGGSSSGSGAAVAAGLVLGSGATDAAGSIRGPSALCGLSGLKPTYGLVNTQGVFPLAQSMDHVGPIARTSQDCALLLEAMTGSNTFSRALNPDLRGRKMGWLKHFYTTDHPASLEVQQAIEEAVRMFESLGCEVEEIQLSPLQDYAACGTIIMLAEAFALHEQRFQKHYLSMGEVFRNRVLLGGLLTSADYLQATRTRRLLIQEWDEKTRDFDVILTATTFGAAPVLESVHKFSVIETPLITISPNITGHPALALCCGFTQNKLPLSMQLIGKRWGEFSLLRIGHAYEQVTAFSLKTPDL